MKDASLVHVVYRLEYLIYLKFDPCLWDVVPSALNRFVEVHVHELKDKSEPTCWLITSPVR